MKKPSPPPPPKPPRPQARHDGAGFGKPSRVIVVLAIGTLIASWLVALLFFIALAISTGWHAGAL